MTALNVSTEARDFPAVPNRLDMKVPITTSTNKADCDLHPCCWCKLRTERLGKRTPAGGEELSWGCLSSLEFFRSCSKWPTMVGARASKAGHCLGSVVRRLAERASVVAVHSWADREMERAADSDDAVLSTNEEPFFACIPSSSAANFSNPDAAKGLAFDLLLLLFFVFRCPSPDSFFANLGQTSAILPPLTAQVWSRHCQFLLASTIQLTILSVLDLLVVTERCSSSELS
jgi:hypothetical protein